MYRVAIDDEGKRLPHALLPGSGHGLLGLNLRDGKAAGLGRSDGRRGIIEAEVRWNRGLRFEGEFRRIQEEDIPSGGGLESTTTRAATTAHNTYVTVFIPSLISSISNVDGIDSGGSLIQFLRKV